MAKELKFPVSQSLQDTVKENEHITEVHFDKNGNHYLHAHEHITKDSKGKETSHGKFARIHKVPIINQDTNLRSEIATPDEKTRIVETVDREDIIKATAVSDFLITPAHLASLPADIQKEVEKIVTRKSK